MTQEVWQRIRRISKQPTHRTKYIVFVLLGFVFALLSLLTTDPWRNILVEFSVTFAAVTLIKVLWELTGGDPSEQQLDNYHSELTKVIAHFESGMYSSLERLQSLIRLADDIAKYNLGIERFWLSRRTFRDDPLMGIKWWRERIFASKEVSILSISLWTDWMQDRKFREGLVGMVLRGAKVRLIVYEPESEIQKMRAWAEGDRDNEMVAEIRRTVDAVRSMRHRLPDRLKDNLVIKYTYEAHHFAQIFRCDDEMLIASYLHGSDGLSSPTQYIHGKDTSLYQKYSAQFEKLWHHAKPVRDL